MPKKAGQSGDGYKQLADALSTGQIGSLYILHGEEHYLLARALDRLRAKLFPDGLSSFDYRRFEGKTLSVEELDDAINTLPAISERTLIEIHDLDMFKHDRKQRMAELFSDLPEYVCIAIIFDTIEFKPDGRVKLDAELLRNGQIIEFRTQEQDKIVTWIKRHFADAGKSISSADAEYLAFVTGGYMDTLHGEIGKTAAYARETTVTRSDIDAVVPPVLDAVVYKLTDALFNRDHTGAMRILDELLRMREPPHKLLFSVSLKMRQLLAARVYINSGPSYKGAIKEICGIRSDYAVRTLIETARRSSVSYCREAVICCAGTGMHMNTSSQPEACLTELIVKLAHLSNL